MRTFFRYLVLLVLVIAGCKNEPPVQPHPNKTPKTFLWLFPDSSLASGTSKQHLRWWGDDPDGVVSGYLFASGKGITKNGRVASPDTLTYHWKTTNDTLIAFPLLVRRDTFDVLVRAVDNTFGVKISDTAIIRLSPFPYWDRDTNGVYDEGIDQKLPTLSGAMDPVGASLDFPLLNQPPSVSIAQNPNDPSVPFQQPETTYTAATFAWVGTDPDGDNTIVAYNIALNNPADSTQWVTLSGTINMITLYVPRSRSDTAGAVVSADLYSGKFLNRQRVGSISGLRLDSLNTFYIQARDIAGDVSPVVQLPAPGKRWFVRKPKSHLLSIIDYITSDSLRASAVYHQAFASVVLPSGPLTTYDELNIGRGISPLAKQDAAAGRANPRFGVLVPPFIDPAFIYTLFLYDYVFWYTDEFPSIPVAQNSLFQYYTTSFDGHKGKVIFSTSFGTVADPLGLLRDFSPLDSVSNVNLANNRLLPTFGDTRLPAGTQLVPDSSDPSDIYPALKLNPLGGDKFVSLRPIYRRADGHYIYETQLDPRTPTRYLNLATLNTLSAVSAVGSHAWACGDLGTIVMTSDGGLTWPVLKSGLPTSFHDIQFVDASTGWAVGDEGAVVGTTDGGATWSNMSVLTFETMNALWFTSASAGVVVGTDGLLIRTTNGGSSWTSVRSHTSMNLHAVNFADAQVGIAVGDSGTMVRTTDGGATWQLLPSVTPQPLSSVWMASPSVGFALGQSNDSRFQSLILKSTDGGASWNIQGGIPIVSPRRICFNDPSHGWITGVQSTFPQLNGGWVYSTVDGGASWGPQNTGLIDDVTFSRQFLNGVSFGSATEGWAVGSGGIIIHSTDGGVTWTPQPPGKLNIGVVDGTRSFVFVGLPLHLFAVYSPTSPAITDVTDVSLFLQHILLQEFAP